MIEVIKRLIKSGIGWVIKNFGNTYPGRILFEITLGVIKEKKKTTRHNGIELTFSVPNKINFYRFDTFSEKEPETLEWIDSIPKESVLWDIGANVGLYTCYAAKARGCKVFAFEPSVFNLEILARNIFLNDLTRQVVIIPLALSESLAFNTLNMESTEWGGAKSTFGQDYGYDGKPLEKTFEFQTMGLSMVDAVKALQIPEPDYIKMDVDGIEHLILKGAGSVLKNIKGILIEIDDDFEKQSVDSARFLTEAGLVLKEKRQADMFKNTPYENSFNQIWQRPTT